MTVYAFSIENFKRSPDEVDTLMTLAREKFLKLMEEKDQLTEKGVKIRVIGNLKLLPIDLQKSIADAMLLTKDNDRSILNVAFAYTSRDEITNSIAMIVKGVEETELTKDDLHHSLIDECMYTNKCSDVDLLVRTSGEMRFSDFLLWQVQSFQLYSASVLTTIFCFRRQQQHFTSLKPFGRNSHSGTFLLPSSTISDATSKRWLSEITLETKSCS